MSPEHEPRIRFHPQPVDPDLAAAQDSIDVAFGDAFEHPHQEIVDALAGSGLVDRKAVHSILA